MLIINGVSSRGGIYSTREEHPLSIREGPLTRVAKKLNFKEHLMSIGAITENSKSIGEHFMRIEHPKSIE